MVGGSFDYHPPQQEIELKVVDVKHPLTEVFAEGHFTHTDEPYFFKNAYQSKHFRPLLYMETSKVSGLKHTPEDSVSYVSWIKRYGKGRVFYVSPSHNAQSYENTHMLQYYLNGLMYVLGEMKCEDTPMEH
ncbi:MAG: ThuA domain-containing protein [Cyclobacteriaceae bacterium]|nr:ThuA domain-containing protein [Cyclobacteriaceae bacterium]